jgi:hypothetical protein
MVSEKLHVRSWKIEDENHQTFFIKQLRRQIAPRLLNESEAIAGIQRYEFHGLSCESIIQQLGGDLPDRLIIAHLGNGPGVIAVKAGKSIYTSMGLTPSGGVIMGTRSGDLDPGVLIYLMRENCRQHRREAPRQEQPMVQATVVDRMAPGTPAGTSTPSSYSSNLF